LFTQLDLNMRQQMWLELIKDYELEVHYHPQKVNVVEDALSRKHHCNNLLVQSLTSCCDLEEPSLWGCSTWCIEQHSSYSNYQGRYHCCSEH
jgi:hypothetical protein